MTQQKSIKFNPNIWFPPRNILYHYARKEQELGNELKTGKYKVIRESRSVALMLLGIMKIQERDYWLQLVNPKEQTPDIRTATKEKRPGKSDWLYTQDVEVVTLNSFSNVDVDDFIKKTKLSGRYAYPNDTTILCHIDKTTNTKPWNDIHKSLSEVADKHDVFLLAKVNPNALIYQIAKIHPTVDILTTFNALEEATLLGPKR